MKVCIVTSTRADFGLLKGLLRRINDSSMFDLQVVATGTHLLEEFGATRQDILNSGFTVNLEVTELTSATTGSDVADQVGGGIVGFSAGFQGLGPDVVVLLGDRYEMLAAAVAAFFLKIPIVHLHGGEVTQGAFDDAIRHSITKFAQIHCVAAVLRMVIVELYWFPLHPTFVSSKEFSYPPADHDLYAGKKAAGMQRLSANYVHQFS